jgi:predicted nucleic acid-binding protein
MPKRLAIFDASPLVFLEVLGYTELLPGLFEVIVPTAVKTELEAKPQQPGAAVPSQPWVSVRTPSPSTLARVEQELRAGAGENAAVALALELNATVISDDLKVRRYAHRIGLPLTGMLGIALILHGRNLAARSLAEEFGLLERHGMWVSEHLKASLLNRLQGR